MNRSCHPRLVVPIFLFHLLSTALGLNMQGIVSRFSSSIIAKQPVNSRSCASCRHMDKIKPPGYPFEVLRIYVSDDGTFPNNDKYPVLIYQDAYHGSSKEATKCMERDREWTSPWTWGIFSYHHYHSTAWELLVCIRGTASVRMGGPSGPTLSIRRGDLILIPPGISHQQIQDEDGFALLGSYPLKDCSASWTGSVDTLNGPPTKIQRDNIRACPVPGKDPIFGLDILTLCTAKAD
jgi:uncharacterized protein YjlB